MDETNKLLVVICDVNPGWWADHDAKRDQNSSFEHCINSLLIFCNSYLMFNHTNKLAFIACHTHKCSFLYPKKEETLCSEQNERKDGKFEVFVELNDQVTTQLKELVNSQHVNQNTQLGQPLLLAGALTKALCYIHSYDKDATGKSVKARIFIMKGSPDVSAQYMSVMNCIFAAQKKNIVIDSCSLGCNSGFLQQASDITNGFYFNVEKLSGLLQYLLWIFLPEPGFREKLQIPSALQIDYRAACFCHKKLVDVGFVCSVCLSIYCQFMPRCLTCQTRFKLPQLPTMAKVKKKKKDNSS